MGKPSEDGHKWEGLPRTLARNKSLPNRTGVTWRATDIGWKASSYFPDAAGPMHPRENQGLTPIWDPLFTAHPPLELSLEHRPYL